MENLAENFSVQAPMGLAEILQLCCLGRQSGQITFRSGSDTGHVYLQLGQVLHATTLSSEGETAIYYMLTWPAGSYSLAEEILPHKRTVGLSWEQLLFEGARLADEGLIGQHLPPSSYVPSPEEQISSTGIQGGLPKLTLLVPDGPPITHDLEQEFTYLGRVSENEIILPYPSVSGRHCIFIRSGPDVILRDLNSSNGTMVNGHTITETVLRLGDSIHVGGIEVKFESGVRRPKLNLAKQPAPVAITRGEFKDLHKPAPQLSSTSKLPKKESLIRELPKKAEPKSAPAPVLLRKVSTGGAISYNDLAPAAPAKKRNYFFLLFSAVLLICLILTGMYLFWYLSLEHKVIDLGPVHIGPF